MKPFVHSHSIGNLKNEKRVLQWLVEQKSKNNRYNIPIQISLHSDIQTVRHDDLLHSHNCWFIQK